jgi:hypothetical protein
VNKSTVSRKVDIFTNDHSTVLADDEGGGGSQLACKSV